ncbi:hypothetical protein SNEBB_005473 [Seison nebaliae]|nr:hypothetical protein SNEBB_005473 [Seison nebaliae]
METSKNSHIKRRMQMTACGEEMELISFFLITRKMELLTELMRMDAYAQIIGAVVKFTLPINSDKLYMSSLYSNYNEGKFTCSFSDFCELFCIIFELNEYREDDEHEQLLMFILQQKR